MNGIGERTGNANLVSIIANLQLKLGERGARPPSAWRASPRPRTSSTSCSTAARPRASRTSAATRSRTRAACTSPASAPTRRRSSTSTPRAVGNARELLVSELAGRAHGQREGRRGRHRARRRRGRARDRARQGARARRLPVRGRRRLASSCCCAGRPATTSRSSAWSRWRVIVEQRADGQVATEATIKIWVDGERFVRTAEGNGPVHALDAALRAAIGEIHPHLTDIELVELQGPHPRRDARHRRDHARAHRRHRRPRRVGLDRRPREHHRRLVAGARRLAGVRRAAQPTGRAEAMSAGPVHEEVPLARPVLGRGGGGRGRSRCCAPASCRSARACRRSRRPSPRASASRTPAPSRAAPPACTWRCARSASPTATRSSRRRSRSSPAPTRRSTSARGPVFADIDPRTLNLDPQRRRRRDHRAHDGAPAGPHLRLPGRPAGVRGARAADRRGRLRGARRRARRRHAGRRARQPGVVRLLRQQAADDRRGRHGHARPTRRSRSASTPSATRAARPTWAGSTTTASASTTA